jgi:hypothetical protein
MSFSATLDVSVPLELVFDGCNKTLVGNGLRHVTLESKDTDPAAESLDVISWLLDTSPQTA